MDRPIPRSATLSDRSVVPYKREVRRFKSYCTHFFRIPVGASLRNADKSNKLKIYTFLCGERTMQYVDAASETQSVGKPLAGRSRPIRITANLCPIRPRP